MGNFNKGNRSSGGKGGKKFGGKRDFGVRSFGGDRGGSDRGGSRGGFGGGRDRERPTMHKAICSDCGKECEVPFRPTGDKPVFCSECFKNKREHNSRNSGDRGGRDFGEKNPRPRFDSKPSYQKDGGKSSENYKAQFEMLNNKLDKILKILVPAVPEETNKETKEIEAPKFIKSERAPKKKKEVETVALKKVLTKAMDKKPAAKKPAPKKVVAKKPAPKKPARKKKK